MYLQYCHIQGNCGRGDSDCFKNGDSQVFGIFLWMLDESASIIRLLKVLQVPYYMSFTFISVFQQ